MFRISSFLLIIRLLQQAPMGSVLGWPDHHSQKRCVSFRPTSPQRRPARSIWRRVVGRMGSFVLDVGTFERMNW